MFDEGEAGGLGGRDGRASLIGTLIGRLIVSKSHGYWIYYHLIGKLFVNHRMCDILGNISMDSCCINITNTDTKEGDLVEIFGENILIEDIAKLIGTTSYEFLSKINRRIRRVYI